MLRLLEMRRFLLLIPLLLLFGAGVFTKSVSRTALPMGCTTQNYSGMIEPGNQVAVYEGEEIAVPEYLALAETNQAVLGVANPSERWVEVDLSDQILRAWDGNTIYLETLVSTGLPWWPTPTGEFRIWTKLRATRMEGGEGKYYYDLPNVPYVMYFENDKIPGWRGFGLHGTYWHNDFGRVHSHGCVNLPTSIAEKLYYWVTPNLTAGKTSVDASSTNPGTRVVIHD